MTPDARHVLVGRHVKPASTEARKGTLYPPEVVASLRAVELMEMVGTTAAKAELERLAKGEPSSVLTHEAKASLTRLAAR